ncbi:MAG: hypothetical protein ACRCUT_03020, partial [Spirochaetota bacterium]
ASDEPVSGLWIEYAAGLEKKKLFSEAYAAYHNAAQSLLDENESTDPEMWRGALRCARGMNDPLLAALLEGLEE